MTTNALLRKRLDEIQAQAKSDREWWDKKRAATRAEFMKEIEADAATTRSGSLAPEKLGSDEDTVLVEAGGPASGAAGGGRGSNKKKKGKK